MTRYREGQTTGIPQRDKGFSLDGMLYFNLRKKLRKRGHRTEGTQVITAPPGRKATVPTPGLAYGVPSGS